MSVYSSTPGAPPNIAIVNDGGLETHMKRQILLFVAAGLIGAAVMSAVDVSLAQLTSNSLGEVRVAAATKKEVAPGPVVRKTVKPKEVTPKTRRPSAASDRPKGKEKKEPGAKKKGTPPKTDQEKKACLAALIAQCLNRCANDIRNITKRLSDRCSDKCNSISGEGKC